MIYNSSEQLYQTRKAAFYGDDVIFAQMMEREWPMACKKLSKKVGIYIN